MGLLTKKSPEERQKERDKRELQRTQYEQAQTYANIIPGVLAKMGLASHTTNNKRRVVTNKVKLLEPIVVHEDYYMVEVDTARLPYRIKIANLVAEEILETISGACKTKVEAQFHPSQGLWYLIPRRGGLGVIPRLIEYDDIIDQMPKSDPIWTFPIGQGENKQLTRIDIRKTPHILIVGSTGAGKTVFVKNMITTLCMKCSPNRLRIVVADFKRGADYKVFNRLPHLGMPYPVKWNDVLLFEDSELITEEADNMNRVLYELEDILHILKWANKEIDRRNGKFDEDITDIDRWNARYRRKPMAHILIVIDELAVIMDQLSSKEATDLQKKLARTAMLGRSAGIHLVIGLQSLLSRYLEGPVSNNIETRIVARCASGVQSGMAMGNGSWSASRLPEIKGRVIWRDGMEENEIQTPWVSPKKAVDLINEINKKWERTPDNNDEEAETLFRWAVTKNNGYLGQEGTYKAFKGQINFDIIKAIAKEYELSTNAETGELEPLIWLDDEQYYLLPHAGKESRRLVTLEKYEAMQAEPVPAPEIEPEPEPTLPIEAIFRYALNELDGAFSYRKLYDAFKGEVSEYQIRDLASEYEGQTITIGGNSYILEPSNGGNKPRTLVRYGVSGNSEISEDIEMIEESDVLEDNYPPIEPDLVIIDNEDDEPPDWLNGVSFEDRGAIIQPKTDPEIIDYDLQLNNLDLED